MRINGKEFRIPEIGFGTVRKLEGYGVSIFDMNFKKKFITIINTFVCISLNIEPDDADYLIEQHLLGGGSFDGWMEEINKAVETSPFFLAIEKKSQKKTAVKKTDQEPEENQ
jgi:hypothetical protein